MAPAPTRRTLRVLAAFAALLLSACNAPPLYGTRAQAFLERQGVPQATILRLVEHKPLSAEEATRLEAFRDTAVRHLLAGNPGIPPPMILRLSADGDEEVRWGAASNPRTPPERLLALRVAGRYATMNEYLARNPALPREVIVAMYRGGEANKVAFAMNPALPEDLMREIAAGDKDLDRTWLAANPALPADLMERLERDESENVRRFLAQNRAYQRWRQSNPG